MVAVVMALQHGTLMESYCRSGMLDGIVHGAGVRKNGDA